MSKIVKRVTLPESIRAFTQHGIEMSSPQIIVIDKQTALSRNNTLYGVFTNNYFLFKSGLRQADTKNFKQIMIFHFPLNQNTERFHLALR